MSPAETALAGAVVAIEKLWGKAPRTAVACAWAPAA